MGILLRRANRTFWHQSSSWTKSHSPNTLFISWSGAINYVPFLETVDVNLICLFTASSLVFPQVLIKLCTV